MKKLACLILVGILLFSLAGCHGGKDDSLHGNVRAADLTDQQAQEILEVLIPKQVEIFFIFQLDYEKIDETQSCPVDEHYKLCTDERFTCVQDIRDFILQVYTGEQAEWYFNVYLDGDIIPTSDKLFRHYLDYDGKLYRNTYSEGKGLNYSKHRMDTARIVERTASTVRVEMDAEKESDEYEETYTFLLCETQDGWRLDSAFLESDITHHTATGATLSDEANGSELSDE